MATFRQLKDTASYKSESEIVLHLQWSEKTNQNYL